MIITNKGMWYNNWEQARGTQPRQTMHLVPSLENNNMQGTQNEISEELADAQTPQPNQRVAFWEHGIGSGAPMSMTMAGRGGQLTPKETRPEEWLRPLE